MRDYSISLLLILGSKAAGSFRRRQFVNTPHISHHVTQKNSRFRTTRCVQRGSDRIGSRAIVLIVYWNFLERDFVREGICSKKSRAPASTVLEYATFCKRISKVHTHLSVAQYMRAHVNRVEAEAEEWKWRSLWRSYLIGTQQRAAGASRSQPSGRGLRHGQRVPVPVARSKSDRKRKAGGVCGACYLLQFRIKFPITRMHSMQYALRCLGIAAHTELFS